MSALPSANLLAQTSGPTTSAQPRGRRRGRAAGPSIPLGSLTQREHRAAIECQACGSTRVTRLTMNLTDGTPVEFTSCHRCEHRTWEHGGDALSVDSVLDRTRRD
jgi:hypothetical protein